MVVKKVSRKKMIRGIFSGESVVSGSKEAKDLYGNKLFGEFVNQKVQYSLSEALFLVEKKKMDVFRNNKKLSFKMLMELCKKIDKKIFVKYAVFKDLRSKGYLLKTALKFGADFRVYDKGVKPGKKHARWILYTVSESDDLTWHEFSAKNRVAHSTRKNLLIGVVDSEGGITFYEVGWVKA
ncbi:tRNA-intron lyase [Candidatus Pacearchaeota archaeon]|nr:tRNA-intron lyase [Candidatus Pacearchaeota archaeon]|tara:strand:+ start:9528 stop:10070 length:543 start_codon:yes stop_codon:yes gene_type:complete